MFIFRLVECRCDCIGVPVYKIVDGYVAIVAQKLVFFDVSAEGISCQYGSGRCSDTLDTGRYRLGRDDRADVYDTDGIRDYLYTDR